MRLFSLPLRLLLPVLFFISGALYSTYIFVYENRASTLMMEKSSLEEARIIGLLASTEIENAFRNSNPIHAWDILNHAASFENVHSTYVFGPDFKVIYASDFALQNKSVQATPLRNYKDVLLAAASDLRSKVFLAEERSVIVACFPFNMVAKDAPLKISEFGLFCFTIDLTSKKNSAMNSAVVRSLTSIIVFSLISLVIWLIIHFGILRRFNVLIRFAREVAEGRFGVLDMDENNEIGTLANELNEMTRRIEHSTQDLKRNSQRLEDAQRIGKMGDWRLEVNSREFTWSPQVYELLAYPTTAIKVGMDDYLNLCPAAERRFVEESFLDVLSGKTAMDIEHRIIRADGQEIWVHLRSEKSGALSQISGTLADITDRRRAEEALRKSEEKYRKLFQDVGDVVYFSSVDGDILEINKAGLELFGYSNLHDIQQIDVKKDMYMNAEDRDAFTESINESGYVKDYPLTLKNRSGEPLHVLVSSNVVRNQQGEVSGYRGIIRDVTKEKQLQNELLQTQKMEAIGTLAGGIAHDFNNILGAIVGYSELLRVDLEKSPKALGYAEQIYKAGLRAKDLVNQILTFSRKRDPEFKEVVLAAVLDEASKFLRATLPSTIRIETEIAHAEGVVLADETQLHQLIMNLSTNAFHAMKENSDGTLELGLDMAKGGNEHLGNNKDARYLRLVVGDNGKGMTEKTRQKIFDPFFTTKSIGEGTGMGLSVVHGIVKSHGGFIRVESEIGKGSKFMVYLPCVNNVQYIARSEELSAPKGKGRVLIVDDERDLLNIEKDMLQYLGYEVQAVNDPAIAENVFKKDPNAFQLIMTDLSMPGFDGAELIRRIRELDTGIPVILMTGYTDTESIERMADLNIHSVLQKPLTMYEIAKAVKNVLNSVQIEDKK